MLPRFRFTHQKAFYGMLAELTDVASQHERVAEQFRDEVVVEIGQLARRLRDQRKEVRHYYLFKLHSGRSCDLEFSLQNLEEALRLQNQLTLAIENMRKTMKDYNRAYKESEAAKSKYDRAEMDMNLSRAEVAKAKNNSIAKLQQAEDAKNTYALQLQRTNEFQHEYYTRLLPTVFEVRREVSLGRAVEAAFISFLQNIRAVLHCFLLFFSRGYASWTSFAFPKSVD